MLVVLCTAPNPETAAELARGLVAARLAACVNIGPEVRSFYVWKGEAQDETESQLIIKTRKDRFESLCAWLNEHHPYDVPEIVGLDVDSVSPEYEQWVRKQTE
jgi:periplasmic divalent cation tolerance protein